MDQIIVYDIPDDDLRTHVSHLLEDYGFVRVQYSVFRGSRSQNTLEMLALELKDLIKKQEADVRFYQICDICLAKTMVVSRIGVDDEGGVTFPCQAG